MLISKQHGIIIFDVVEETECTDRTDIQDDIFNKTRSKLLQYKTLIQKRKLMVEIGVITWAAGWTSGDLDSGIIINQQELELFLQLYLA